MLRRIDVVTVNRPRVAAIGLNDAQLDAIRPLCGDLREAASLGGYRRQFSWSETDILVAVDLTDDYFDTDIPPSVSLMTWGEFDFTWSGGYIDATDGKAQQHYARADTENNERELSVTGDCPDLYESLATELTKRFGPMEEAPAALETSRDNCVALIQTTTGEPIAMRILLPSVHGTQTGDPQRPIGLLLPSASDLASWFAAFLRDLHEACPSQVPMAPPRLSKPADWQTTQERELAKRISEIDVRIADLTGQRTEIAAKLDNESDKLDKDIRRALWADGDELTAAASEILSNIGFNVRDMDAELQGGKPKREDLRLAHPAEPNWEAIVEVKGYPNDARTNDTRQIREYRERFIQEEGHPPKLTLWLANPHRQLDPAARPVPNANVKEAAEIIGAVYMEARDLLQQWLRVDRSEIDVGVLIDSLITAAPGLWVPPDTGGET